ncbi:hypothetical protein ACJ41P_10300 [Azospirillum argentinense]|uniref:Uncharacterized protein n=1 Tax=Azospirillum argentinense TaxID=2970906 RepID=A0ABW8V5P3_9PROT
MTSPVYCDECDHRTLASKNDQPWRWQCIKHPRPEGYGFVARGTWVNFPPYHYCKDMNRDGKCKDFAPARVAPEKDEAP